MRGARARWKRGARRIRARAALACLAVAMVVSGGCDEALQPYGEEYQGAFSISGTLDLRADTQWLRVMPVRFELLPGPEPIDALVTLEHLRSGRMVTLRDSLFRFESPGLDAVAYAHNFWTTERLQPSETYRVTAKGPSGDSTTALVTMPPALDFTFRAFPLVGEDTPLEGSSDAGVLRVRAEKVILVDMLYWMAGVCPAAGPLEERAFTEPVHQRLRDPVAVPGVVGVPAQGNLRGGDCVGDLRRREMRVATARADWPFAATQTDVEVTTPGIAPSNVENGLGFVGGIATWRFPFHRCTEIAPRPDGRESCELAFNAGSSAVAGRVVRQPCGAPHTLAYVALRLDYAGGGAALLSWYTGARGEYRFEGIEPGARLTLSLRRGASPLPLPPLAPGQRYAVPEVVVAGDC